MATSGFSTKYTEICKVLRKFETLGEKYIFYVHHSRDDVLFLGITNGINVWKSELTEDDIESNRMNADLPSKEAYLSELKISLESDEIHVSILSQNLTLTVGSNSSVHTFTLFETSAQQKKDELQRLIFVLTDNVMDLGEKLKDRERKLELQTKESQKRENENVSPFKDTVVKRPKAASRLKQGKGHSVINPGSKRKQVAKGVQFQ